MSDQYVGEIRMFAGSAIPSGWMTCDGRLLAISQNTALFSILGTDYGGDGRITFGLPDLQGAAALGTGAGMGLTPYSIGENGGQATVTLSMEQMAIHTHLPAAQPSGTLGPPEDTVWANPGDTRPPPNFFASARGTAVSMNPQAIGITGKGQPHNNLMPYLVFVFCIALEGVFPPRE